MNKYGTIGSMTDYTYFAQLVEALPEIPVDSIVSRTVLKDAKLHAILFGFAPGQELSEHTSAFPAILHFIEGEADLTLGEDQQTAVPGTWVYMPPKLPHSITAKTPVKMLLLMLRG